MNIQDYKKENDALRQRVAELEKSNNELIIHNMQLGRKVQNTGCLWKGQQVSVNPPSWRIQQPHRHIPSVARQLQRTVVASSFRTGKRQ